MRLQTALVGKLSIAALVAASLTGCANVDSFAMGDLPVPANSPVAIAARDAARNPGAFPTFAGIPRADAHDLGPMKSTMSNTALLAQADSLRAAAAASPPIDQAAIEAYATQQKALLAGVPVPSATDIAEIEAFAAAARARAIPPPVPK